MATYPPMSNDQRDAVTMLHQRDSQHISYSSEANTIIPGNSTIMQTDFSSNPNREESILNFGGESQFLTHSMAGNSNVFERAHQGLSLSLATRAANVINPIMQLSSSVQFHNEPSILGCNNSADGEDKDATTTSNYASHIGRVDVESKYLKAAQELLDEVVSVKKDSFLHTKNVRMESSSKENNYESTDADLRDLSSAEKQELQDKLTKLLWMLDEVDRRYRQYYHQMHMVVSSFDAISGSGSAKPYTSLALQTISRHFRTLRDAINGQIHHARKNLGGEDYSSCSNDKSGIGISRLRYVDQQIRQQRALQQLGMMQPHTWRPQRGLPEASVTILRAWLFEHFLHPYPKDSDKVMLARQTGLTRSQVSNWFINARVRLWKPMIEEMYKEEEANGIGDADMDSNSSSDNIVPSASTMDKSITREDHRIKQQNRTPPSSNSSVMLRCDPKTNPARDIEMVNGSDGFSNPLSQDSNQVGPSNCGYYTEQQNETNEPIGILPGAVLQSNNAHRFFGGYDVSDQLKRFGGVSGISLTLGLQQECEGNANMVREGFVPVRGNDINNDAYNTTSFSYGGS